MAEKKLVFLLCAAQKIPAIIAGDPLEHLLKRHKPNEFFQEVNMLEWEDVTDSIERKKSPGKAVLDYNKMPLKKRKEKPAAEEEEDEEYEEDE